MEVLLQALAPNPETGFLEAESPANAAFSSDKKLRAIELANQYISQKSYPSLVEICDSLGVTVDTFYKHLHRDQKFSEAWKDVKLRINDVFTKHLETKAKSKMGVVANLAILKYNESGTWLDQSKINLQTQIIIAKTDVIDAKSYVEAEETAISGRNASESKQLASNSESVERQI